MVGFGFMRLMLYFVIQAVASLNIFVFFSISVHVGILFSILLKLSIFPFFFWYLPVFSKLPNVVLFLASSFHKVPSFLIVSKFLVLQRLGIIFFIAFLTLIFRAFLMVLANNLRFIIILSSIGNNSWILLASFFSIESFFFFFVAYSVSVFLLLLYFNSFFSFPAFQTTGSVIIFSLVILSVGGFPPFPLFFSKLAIVFFIVSARVYTPVLLLLVLLRAMVMMGSYLRFCLLAITNLFGNTFFMLL